MKYSHSHHLTVWANKALIMAITVIMPMTTIAAPSTIAELPDPTRLLVTSNNNASQKPRLQSILYSGPRKSIVINGQVKFIGSAINGGRIIDIQHNTVVIHHHGRLKTLQFNTSKSVTRRGSQ